MGRARGFFSSLEFQAVAFCTFMFLYVWPLLSAFGEGDPEVLYRYFSIVFALHLCSLLALGWSLKSRPEKGDGADPGSDGA
jgi:hypothetical protein